jgi:hypothetical protein
MALEPNQVAPGNRIKYNNQESDVVDRLTWRVRQHATSSSPGPRQRRATSDSSSRLPISRTRGRRVRRHHGRGQGPARKQEAPEHKDQADGFQALRFRWQESQQRPVQADDAPPTPRRSHQEVGVDQPCSPRGSISSRCTSSRGRSSACSSSSSPTTRWRRPPCSPTRRAYNMPPTRTPQRPAAAGGAAADPVHRCGT